MNEFLTSNEWPWCLARTIAQGELGVVVANVDMLVGCAVLAPEWRTIAVTFVRAALSPLIAELGLGAAFGWSDCCCAGGHGLGARTPRNRLGFGSGAGRERRLGSLYDAT